MKITLKQEKMIAEIIERYYDAYAAYLSGSNCGGRAIFMGGAIDRVGEVLAALSSGAGRTLGRKEKKK